MLDTGLIPVPWEQFGDTVWRNGETQFKEIEQRTFEDNSMAQNLSNEGMMGVSIVVWSATTISALRQAGWAE
jgi:hypothetical protein